jgi:hypothetical protein
VGFGLGDATGIVEWCVSHASELRESLGATAERAISSKGAGGDGVNERLLMFGVEGGLRGAGVAENKGCSSWDDGRDGVPAEQATSSKGAGGDGVDD